MGIAAVFEAIRTLVLVDRPNVVMEMTSEVTDIHAEPERIVWMLPELGREQYTRDRVTVGSAHDPSGTDGVIWNRKPTCLVHFWVPARTVRDIEVPDDNEDPSLGTVWLPGVFLNAVQTVGGGAVYPGQAGFMPRSMGNLGFAYVMELSFDLAVWRLKTTGTATIETVSLTGSYT